MATRQSSFVEERRGDTGINVLIGAVVAFVVSTVFPFGGQLLGGGAAGYLQDTTRTEGAKLGAIAAALSSVPGLAFAFLIVVPIFVLPLLTGDAAMGAFSGAVLLFGIVGAVVGIVVSTVVGAAGGYVGAILAED